MPVTTETDEVPVVKTFEVSSGDTLPTPEETPGTQIPKTPSDELPKTGDSSLALYAFMASAFGLVVLMASSFIGRHNADETANVLRTAGNKRDRKGRERKSCTFFRNKDRTVPFRAPVQELHRDCFSPHPSRVGAFCI